MWNCWSGVMQGIVISKAGKILLTSAIILACSYYS